MPGTLKQIEERLRAKMDAKKWSADLPGDQPIPKRPQTHTVKTRGAGPPLPLKKMPQLVPGRPAPRPPVSFDIEGDGMPETAPEPPPKPAKKGPPTRAVVVPPDSKTVGVKVPPAMYKELQVVKEERNLPSLKDALLLAVKHGLPHLTTWHRR